MTTSPLDSDATSGFLRGQARVFEDIARGVPLDRCLDGLARLIQGQTPGMRCSVVLLDAARARLRLAAAPDLPAELNAAVDGLAYDPAVGTCCPAMHARRLAVTANIFQDPCWAPHRELAARCGLRACWSQPILGLEGEALGAFALYGAEPGEPDAREREVLQVGAHLAAVAAGRDEREAAVQRCEAKWRAVFEHSLDAVLVVDDARRFVDANTAACRLFGAERGQVIGALMDDWFFPPPPPDHGTHWDEFLRTGSHVEECAVRRADGSARRASFRARAGVQPGLHLCAIRDITEQQAAARALRQAEHLYRSLVETTGTGYAVADAQGRVADANARYVHLSGHARLGEILGRSPLEWTAPYDRERFAVALALCAAPGPEQAGQIRNLEVDFLDAGGESVPVGINATVVQTEAGARLLCLCHDISGRAATRRELESRVAQRTAQLAQANAQLAARARQQEAVAALGRYALAGMSEEELMAEAAGTVVALLEVEFCGIVEHADPASEHLILRATLGWQAEERIGQPVATTDPATLAGYALRSPEPVVFEDAATEDRFALGPGMHASGIVSGVTARIGSDPRPFGLIGGHSATPRQFTCDDVHFMQSVANVVAIAVERQRAETALRAAQQSAEQANRAKGEFLSRVSHELRTPLNAILGFGQLLEVEALTPGQRESVEQVTRAGRHLLGLVNEVLDIARTDAGQPAPDLPAAPGGSQEAELDALLRETLFGRDEPVPPPPPPLRTVLHIDDHEPNRTLVSLLLARRPHLRLLTATRGREGLELARTHRPDLVLLDLHLPDLPGEEVLGELRRDERTRGAAVAILSADAAAVRRHQQSGAGADAYLLKPFNVQEFLGLLDGYLG